MIDRQKKLAATYIIAEAGVNHNGDTDNALALLETAAEAGVDAIKFQTFNAKSLVTSAADMADYQKENTGRSESQLEMLMRLELSYEDHITLADRSRELGIDFLSTAFDSESLSFLTTTIGVPALKIASGEISNGPLLLEHARQGLDIILSTGMATLSDIETALSVIAFARYYPKEEVPNPEKLRRAYLDQKSQADLRAGVTILHCTTQYPTPPGDANLAAMDTLRSAFNLPTGYSDHTTGIAIPIAAVARGATMIEKHFTLDRRMEGPDHAASLEPGELREMVESIRAVEDSFGDPIKGPTAGEQNIMAAARKSLVAACSIEKGQPFTSDNLDIKRPGTGRSPMEYWTILGKNARQSYHAGDLIVD